MVHAKCCDGEKDVTYLQAKCDVGAEGSCRKWDLLGLWDSLATSTPLP